MNTEERQKLIKEASQAYYSDGTSPLSDAEFDALLEEERQENPDSPLLAVGHGYVLNEDSTPGEKYEHKYGIVGSLLKCHDWYEFPKSLKNTKVCSTLKLDGLSCAMYYRNGVMYQALTRGEGGIKGIDITDKIYKIVPDYVTLADTSFTGAVRGEILMSLSNFEEYCKTHENAKSARNTAAGFINAKEITKDLEYLTVVVYTVIGIESDNVYPFPLYPFSDYESMHNWLCDNFSHVVQMFNNSYSQEVDFMRDMELLRETMYGVYPSDGIVITSDKIEFDSHSVKNGAYIKYDATAFKFKAESAETYVTGIEWTLSKTKYLIPVIQVNPVKLSGAVVKRCSGCNALYILNNKISIGKKVRITRANEVIPKILEIQDEDGGWIECSGIST